MSCKHYEELISAALDCELRPEEQTELDAHLQTCSDCRQFAEDVDSLHGLASCATPLRLPASRQQEIMRKTVGPKSLWSRLWQKIHGPRPVPRTLAWAGSMTILILIGSVAITLFWPETETVETFSDRFRQGRPVLNVTVSESDIVATSSILKVSLTEHDIVRSTTLVFSED